MGRVKDIIIQRLTQYTGLSADDRDMVLIAEDIIQRLDGNLTDESAVEWALRYFVQSNPNDDYNAVLYSDGGGSIQRLLPETESGYMAVYFSELDFDTVATAVGKAMLTKLNLKERPEGSYDKDRLRHQAFGDLERQVYAML